MAATILFTEARLRGFCEAALEAAGLPADDAAACADAIVFANLRGVDTHGVRRILPELLESIERGAVVPGATPLTVRDRGPIAVLKGNGAPGPVIARRALAAWVSARRRTTKTDRSVHFSSDTRVK